jgi:hypothetical protein
MVSFLRLSSGLVIALVALVASVSSLEDDLRLMADFLETDRRYTTAQADHSFSYTADKD